MAKESYSKVIFPFAKDELNEIDGQMHSDKAQQTIQQLRMLKKLLNVRQQLLCILPESEQKIQLLLQNMPNETLSKLIKERYQAFLSNFFRETPRMFRIIDKVRTEYRNLIVHMLKQGNRTATFSLEDLAQISKSWENIYIWLFLRVLCGNIFETTEELNEYMNEEQFGITEEMKHSLGDAWRYILENEYIHNADRVIEYSRIYFSDMEKGEGTAYEKRERILSYIEGARDRVLRREHLLNCWNRYVREIFDILQQMEEEQYQVMEGLADWDAIEKEIREKGIEKTNDADN